MNTSDPFVDPAGKPRLRNSVTGFLDVLGFSQLSAAAGNVEESQQILDRVASAIRDSRASVHNHFIGDPISDPSRWATKFFSDNLALGFPADESDIAQDQIAQFAIRCVQRYQLCMALNGFFVRGAMTLGLICLTDEIIFGPSLIESYALESKTSIVPRVILTKPLQELLVSTGSASHDTAMSICRDIDGWWFVNYLYAAHSSSGIDWGVIQRHKASVLESIQQTTQHNVLPKYGWSVRYHNVFCNWHRHDPGYADDYRIKRTDEQSKIQLLRDFSGLAD